MFSGTLWGQGSRQPYQLPVMNFAKDADGYYLNVADEEYVRYMWESFVALNWPAKAGARGEPDTAANAPASRHPVVWETLAQPQEVFLAETQWASYPAWNELPRLPAGLSLKQARALCQGFSVDNDIVLYDINQPNTSIRSGPVAPLMDQHRRYVRYQVALNRPFFEYIRSNQYYDADKQAAAVRVSEKARFEKLSDAPEGARCVSMDMRHQLVEISVAKQPRARWPILQPAG
jgi:hypothetical protein